MRQVQDDYARQAAINAAVNLYWEAGLEAEAGTLLTAELGKTRSPYYFMLDLAELAEKAGRKQEAVQWLARAYDGAQGPATRFQWGYNYLVGLLEMTPEDTRGIERVGLSVIGELDGAPDAFYQRTRTRLEQLDSKLQRVGCGRRGGQGRRRAACADRRDLPQAAGRRSGPAELRGVPQACRASHSVRVIEYFTAARSSGSRPSRTSSG